MGHVARDLGEEAVAGVLQQFQVCAASVLDSLVHLRYTRTFRTPIPTATTHVAASAAADSSAAADATATDEPPS